MKNTRNKNIAFYFDDVVSAYEVCLEAYSYHVYPKSVMDVILEVQDLDEDVVEKLECIFSTMKFTERALYKYVSLSDNSITGITDELDLKYKLAKDIYPYMEKIQKRYTKEQERELLAFKNISALVHTLMDLIRVTAMEQVNNRKRKMERLLQIGSAVLKETENFWNKWKYEAEEIVHNLPMQEIIENFYYEYGVHPKAVELMMPEVVAAFLLDYKGGELLLHRLWMSAEGMVDRHDERLEGYKQVLEFLEKGFLLQEDVPLKEQLYGLNNEIMVIVSESQMKDF